MRADDTSSSQHDDGEDDLVGLETYISSDRLRKLKAQNSKYDAGPSTSQPSGRQAKRQRDVHSICESNRDEYRDVGDVFVLDDDEETGLGNLPSRDIKKDGARRKSMDANDTRTLLQTCLEQDDIVPEDDDPLSDEGDELDVFRLTQKSAPSDHVISKECCTPSEQEHEDCEEQETMIELRFVDQHRHEFMIRALHDSPFDYPCSRFVEHAQAQGWISQGVQSIQKYVFDGDILDIQKDTPKQLDMEDGDTVDVHYC